MSGKISPLVFSKPPPIPLKLIIEGSWECARPVYACFIDLEKAYDRVPREKLWEVLETYGIGGSLLGAIGSLYENCRSRVRINGVTSDPFEVIQPVLLQELQCLDNIKMDDIVYKPIYPERYDDVIRHLRFNFFADEPLNKSLSLCKPGQPHEELEEFSLSVLSQGVSFMGVLRTTGEVVGVLLNAAGEEECDKGNGYHEKLYKDQKLQKIFDFLGSVDKDVDYFSNFNVSNILELKILSVDMKFRGRGIAGRLYEITEQFAQSRGYTLLRADATALFSQKLFQKYGFSTLKEIIYEEYPSKDAPIFIVDPPHLSFKLMVKKLPSNCSQ